MWSPALTIRTCWRSCCQVLNVSLTSGQGREEEIWARWVPPCKQHPPTNKQVNKSIKLWARIRTWAVTWKSQVCGAASGSQSCNLVAVGAWKPPRTSRTPGKSCRSRINTIKLKTPSQKPHPGTPWKPDPVPVKTQSSATAESCRRSRKWAVKASKHEPNVKNQLKAKCHKV